MKGLIVTDKKRIEMSTGLEKPSPKPGEALIRVKAASVNPYDLESAAGIYDGFYAEHGDQRPVQTGLELAGIVESSSGAFQPGDRVYGYVHLIGGWKAHAEYVTLPEDYLAPIPGGLSFNQAAGLPLGIMTALTVFEDLSQKSKDARVLILGASGGVGVYAVQIAKILGHHVTALASKVQGDSLRALGADRVHDYQTKSLDQLAEAGERYDLILDLSARYRLDECAGLLSPSGKFVPALPDAEKGGESDDPRAAYLMVVQGQTDRLRKAENWIADGRLRPVLAGEFSFDNHEEAFDYLGKRGKTGRIVMAWAS